jgi:transposase
MWYAYVMTTTCREPAITWREGRRLRAWTLHQQGWTQQHIAAALGVTQGAVSQWLRRAQAQGVSALRPQPRRGPQPRLTPDQLAQLPTLLSRGPAAFGFRGEVWIAARVARVIQDEFGVRYHPAHVSRLLRHLDWTPQKPHVQASQRDDAAIRAWQGERWPALKKKRSGSDARSSG